MKRKTILLLWIIGFIVAIIGAGMFVPALVAAANHCTTNPFGGQNCSLPPTDPLTLIGLIGVVVLLIGGLIGTISWVGALIRSARMHAWGWFVVVLIFSYLGVLIYALANSSELPAMVEVDAVSASPH